MAPCQQLLFMELETQFECDQLTSGPHVHKLWSSVGVVVIGRVLLDFSLTKLLVKANNWHTFVFHI